MLLHPPQDPAPSVTSAEKPPPNPQGHLEGALQALLFCSPSCTVAFTRLPDVSLGRRLARRCAGLHPTPRRSSCSPLACGRGPQVSACGGRARFTLRPRGLARRKHSSWPVWSFEVKGTSDGT